MRSWGLGSYRLREWFHKISIAALCKSQNWKSKDWLLLISPVTDDEWCWWGFNCRVWVIVSHSATKHSKLHLTDVVFPPLDRPRRQIGKSSWFMTVRKTTLIDKGYSMGTSEETQPCLLHDRPANALKPTKNHHLCNMWYDNLQNSSYKVSTDHQNTVCVDTFFHICCTYWLKWSYIYFLIRY